MLKSTRYLIVAAIFLLGSMATVVQADLIIATDDFSANTITSESRLRVENTADEWIKFSSSLWSVTGGTLNNAGTTSDRDSEGGLLRVVNIADAIAAGTGTATDYTEIEFSFDYSVGTGAELYFYGVGLNGGTLATTTFQLHNTGASNGSIQSQYDGNVGTTQGDFTGVNLFTGAAAPSGITTDALTFAAGTSGTFTQTFDISSFTGINDISDFQLLTFGWAANVTDTTNGGISIDNFSAIATAAAVPEPSSLALLGVALGAVCLRRRK